MGVNLSQLERLSQLLDVASLRHRVIAENIANVNTPGYHRLDISFEDAFARATKHDGSLDRGGTAPRVIVDNTSPERVDGNNVDIDIEMGNLNKNALLYGAYTQILANNLNTLRIAITGR
jgi:flagellar basal-body rod protein FlgB